MELILNNAAIAQYQTLLSYLDAQFKAAMHDKLEKSGFTLAQREAIIDKAKVKTFVTWCEEFLRSTPVQQIYQDGASVAVRLSNRTLVALAKGQEMPIVDDSVSIIGKG